MPNFDWGGGEIANVYINENLIDMANVYINESGNCESMDLSLLGRWTWASFRGGPPCRILTGAVASSALSRKKESRTNLLEAPYPEDPEKDSLLQ